MSTTLEPQSPYWQHNEPLHCPKEHRMIWLGVTFWYCEQCVAIYAETTSGTRQT